MLLLLPTFPLTMVSSTHGVPHFCRGTNVLQNRRNSLPTLLPDPSAFSWAAPQEKHRAGASAWQHGATPQSTCGPRLGTRSPRSHRQLASVPLAPSSTLRCFDAQSCCAVSLSCCPKLYLLSCPSSQHEALLTSSCSLAWETAASIRSACGAWAKRTPQQLRAGWAAGGTATPAASRRRCKTLTAGHLTRQRLAVTWCLPALLCRRSWTINWHWARMCFLPNQPSARRQLAVIVVNNSALSFAAAAGELRCWISDCTLELLMVL